MADLSNDYLNVNTPQSTEDFNAEMANIEATPYDDSGDNPPFDVNVPEITVTNSPTELVAEGEERLSTTRNVEGLKGYAGDVGNGAATGVMNAGTEIAHTIANVTDFLMPDEWGEAHGYPTDAAQRGAERFFPRLTESDFNAVGLSQPATVVGKTTQVITQFMTGFAPALKAVRGVKAMQSMGRLAQTAKTAVGTGTAGAVADLSVFNPYEERISNMAVESGIPGFDNVVTQYLKADADDPELLARVKQTAEGYVVGKVLEPFIALLGATKKSKMVYAEEMGLKEPTDLTKVAYMTDPATGAKVSAADSPRFTLDEAVVSVPDEAVQADFAKSYLDGDLEGAAQKASGLINLKHINTEEGIRDLIEGFAVVRDHAVGKTKRSLKQAAKNAGKLGADAVAEGAARTEGLDAFVINAREVRAAVAYKVKDLAHIAKSNPTKANLAEFEDAFRKLIAIDALASKVDSEIARAMRAMQRPITGDSLAGNIVSLGKTKATDLEKIAQMTSELSSSDTVIKMARASTMPNWKDATVEVYINGLFSPPTFVVNALSNTLSMAGVAGERYLGAAKSQLTGTGELTFREANQYALGLARGITDGVHAFSTSWKTNAPVMGHETKFLETDQLAGFQGAAFGITDESVPLMQKLGKGLDLVGIGLRSIPGGTRSLMASDEFFKAMFYRGEIAALAQREAHKAGLKKGTPEYLGKVQEIMEGANKAKVGEPYHGITMAAEEAAHRNTFTEALGEGGTKLMEGMRHGYAGLLSYAVLPFVKTPTNLMKYMWRRTPGLAGQSDYMLGELAAGGARRDLAEAQIGAGTMWLTTGMMMAGGGYLRGAMTDNYASRRNLQQLEVEQQALVNPEDGTQITIGRLDGNPISFLLFAATTQETVSAYLEANADELTPEELEDGVMEIMAIPIAVGTKLSMNKTWLAGMSQALDSLKNDTLGKYSEKIAGNLVPAGGTLKWLKSQGEIDPYLREASSVMEHMRNKIPGLSRTLPPAPDLLGNPREVTQMSAFGTNPVTMTVPNDHPVMAELRRLQMGDPNKVMLGGVPRTISAGEANIKLDGVEKWNLMQFARQLKDANGKDMIDNIQEIIDSPDYQDMTDKQKNNHLAVLYKNRIKFAKKALQYDSQLHAQGLARPYAEEYDLYDYTRKTPLSDKASTKEYSKAKALFGNVGMSRDDFIEKRNEELVQSNLGVEIN